ncbi:MAG: HIRAN domain-containing protein [Lachnospiraceae bacterium]|nr:HIRAN domain-containing protein [Lachnospiraceae bacterium]
MANELTKAQSGVVALVDSREIGDVLKPLIREIHLFDSYIAGTTHLKESEVLDNVKTGDMLNLKREDNKFDDKAILVLNDAGQKLGYVPEKDNVVFARLMDAGKLLKAKVTDVELKGGFHMIRIGIYLVDF